MSCGSCIGCILFILAMTILLSFVTVVYKGIVAKCSSSSDKNVSQIEIVTIYNHSTFSDLNQRIIKQINLNHYHDCNSILEHGEFALPDGPYKIMLKYGSSAIIEIRVRCDMNTLGGGWTVIQSRGQFANPENFFDRDWSDYERGFGDEEGEFWMGLAVLQRMAERQQQEILVQMWDENGRQGYAR